MMLEATFALKTTESLPESPSVIVPAAPAVTFRSPLMVVVPDVVNPVAPEMTPAAVMFTVGVLKRFVYPTPPVFVILMAFVTTVEPEAEVSALSMRKSASTALSVTFAVSWFETLRAFSVFPASEGLFVKRMSTRLMVVAAVALPFVTERRIGETGPAAAGFDEVVTARPVPVVREDAVRPKAVPAVVDDESETVPYVVSATLPEDAVTSKLPEPW